MDNSNNNEKEDKLEKTLQQIKHMIEGERSDKDALLNEILVVIEQELK